MIKRAIAIINLAIFFVFLEITVLASAKSKSEKVNL